MRDQAFEPSPEDPLGAMLLGHVDGRTVLLRLRLAEPPRGHGFEVVPVLRCHPVTLGEDEPRDAVVVPDKAHAPGLPGVEVDEPAGLAAVRVVDALVELGPLPRGQVGRRAFDVDLGGDDEVQHERRGERLADDGDPPDLPCPPRADRVSLAALDPGVTDCTAADAARVEGVDVHEPARGFGPADPLEATTEPSREVRQAVRDVGDELLEVGHLTLCGAQVRDLEEWLGLMPQVEAVAEGLEVARRETDRAWPVAQQGRPCSPIPGTTARPVQDRQEQPEDREVLGGDLPDELVDVLGALEDLGEAQLDDVPVTVKRRDPWFVDEVERFPPVRHDSCFGSL